MDKKAVMGAVLIAWAAGLQVNHRDSLKPDVEWMCVILFSDNSQNVEMHCIAFQLCGCMCVWVYGNTYQFSWFLFVVWEKGLIN